jgi:hypothetical protein
MGDGGKAKKYDDLTRWREERKEQKFGRKGSIREGDEKGGGGRGIGTSKEEREIFYLKMSVS